MDSNQLQAWREAQVRAAELGLELKKLQLELAFQLSMLSERNVTEAHGARFRSVCLILHSAYRELKGKE